MNKCQQIKVLQYMYGDLEYFPWSERINRHYCHRHGYEYVLSQETPRCDRHPSWHRLPMILDEFHDCEYMLFMDADAVFYSQELRIEEELIPLMENNEILMAQDFGSEMERWNPGFPNAGVILMKVSEKVRKFVEIWNQASEMDESTRWFWPVEQLALWRVVMPKFPDMVKVHKDYYMIQGLYGLYIRHYMQLSDHDRKNKLQALCELRSI